MAPTAQKLLIASDRFSPYGNSSGWLSVAGHSKGGDTVVTYQDYSLCRCPWVCKTYSKPSADCHWWCQSQLWQTTACTANDTTRYWLYDSCMISHSYFLREATQVNSVWCAAGWLWCTCQVGLNGLCCHNDTQTFQPAVITDMMGDSQKLHLLPPSKCDVAKYSNKINWLSRVKQTQQRQTHNTAWQHMCQNA